MANLPLRQHLGWPSSYGTWETAILARPIAFVGCFFSVSKNIQSKFITNIQVLARISLDELKLDQ